MVDPDGQLSIMFTICVHSVPIIIMLMLDDYVILVFALINSVLISVY